MFLSGNMGSGLNFITVRVTAKARDAWSRPHSVGEMTQVRVEGVITAGHGRGRDAAAVLKFARSEFDDLD